MNDGLWLALCLGLLWGPPVAIVLCGLLRDQHRDE